MKPPKRHRKPSTRSSSTTQSTSKRRKVTTEQQKSVEVQMGAHGPEAEVVAPRSERATEIDHDQPTSSGILHHNVINGPLVTSGPALSPNATRQNTGTFYQNVDMLGAGVSQGSMGLAIVQVSQTPVCIPSILDLVSGHIPVKIKETIWAGEYVDLNILLKSAKDLVSDSHLNGDLTVKGGQLTLLQHKQNPITNIHIWTSAFMIFMGVMLEKWPIKGQELLKYMHNVS